MIEWEYQKISLNDVSRRTDDIDLLCSAGAQGWELVAVLPNNVAYLKRPQPTVYETRPLPPKEQSAATAASAPATERPNGVKPKYRDPQTNDTWSGRGRMASWLKRKQDAGENIENYLV